MHALNRRTPQSRRITAGFAALSFMLSQFVMPMPTAEASSAHIGSSTTSAGSLLPPSVAATESFQPDLFTGRATTSYPIQVPPGRKGLQPNIALSYSSSGGSSWVGVGWGLDMGFIERTSKYGTPQYNDAADTFAFALGGIGSELIEIATGEYRSKDEGAFMKFEKTAQGWLVHDRSGTQYHLGYTASSRIEKSTTEVYRWMLNYVEDVHGNYMELNYTDGLIDTIEYTGHVDSNTAPSYKVIFHKRSRINLDDHLIDFRGGFEHRVSSLLDRIEIQSSNETVCQYQFTYTQSPRTHRSMLKEVVKIGRNGTPMERATLYDYQDAPLTFAPLVQETVNAGTPGQTFYPHLSGDPDGNGVTDLITYNGTTSRWKVFCVEPSLGKCNFTSGQEWLFWDRLNNETVPLLGDWNGDGKTDIAGFHTHQILVALSDIDPNTQEPIFNNVHSFHDLSGANDTVQLTEGTPFTGDFNGDSMTDIGIYKDGTWSMWLSTGSGFVREHSFDMSLGDSTGKILTGDFNGDGLTDVAIRYASANYNVIVRFSTGSQFVKRSYVTEETWLGGADFDISGVDMNGDGRTDLMHYVHDNDPDFPNEAGQIKTWYSDGNHFEPGANLPQQFDITAANAVIQFGDFNGDGLLEPGVFRNTDGLCKIGNSTSNVPDILSTITSPIGGRTEITYGPSSDNADASSANLPFVLQLVKETQTHDGLGHSYVTHYSYTQGQFHAKPETRESEFWGFGKVIVSDADHVQSITQFHQNEHLKGRPYFTQIQDSEGNIWTEQDQEWICEALETGQHYVKLVSDTRRDFDGNATYLETKSTFEYDNYGNTTRVNALGWVDASDPNSLLDNQATETTYNINTAAWILDKPATVKQFDHQGTLLSQKRFVYDNNANHTDTLSSGLLTREDVWLVNDVTNPSDARWLPTTMQYNSFGNLTHITDSIGRTTQNIYGETSNTFITKIINALGHERTWVYDTASGQVLQSTDPNGLTTLTDYDEFDRVIASKTLKPGASSPITTSEIEYTLGDFTLAEPILNRIKTTVYANEAGTESFAQYQFSDGLGRTVQSRSPASDGTQQVVSGTVELDHKGQTIKQWISFVAPFSSSYIAPNTNQLHPPVEYTYDAVGRLIQTSTPHLENDPAISTVSYDDWVITTTDAEGKLTVQHNDAFGRLEKVFEHGITHPTVYTYDALGNILSITDSTGHNTTTLTYDSLGRKLSMNDPNMGFWTYAYDDADNLIAQTDARNHTITFDYDDLNRLTHKHIPAITEGTLVPEAYLEQGGEVVIEAELYDQSLLNTGSMEWSVGSSVSGASGDHYVMVDDNSGSYGSGYKDNAPELQYRIHFHTTGTYYLWTRGYADDWSTDSVHYGFNGQDLDSTNNANGYGHNKWTWRHKRWINGTDDRRTIYVDQPGDHILNLWVRDDGTRVDKIMLTKNASTSLYGSSWQGPAMSERRPESGDFVEVAPASTISYNYNDPAHKNKISSIYDTSGNTQFTYNDFGRLITETKSINGEGSFTIQRSYDLLGRLKNLQYPDGEVLSYTYNNQGGVATIDLTDSSGTQPILSALTYDANGQVDTITYGNGVTTQYDYDVDTLRLKGLLSRDASGNPIQNLAYSFDKVGNITHINDGLLGHHQSFTYDDLHRLVSANGVYGHLTYDYDDIGNMINKAGTTMTYGDNAPAHAVTSTSSGLTMSYDANGNMLSKIHDIETLRSRNYIYDVENRLIEAALPDEGAVTVEFQPGWNFFALPLAPGNADISTLFPNFAAQIEQISRLNSDGEWEHFVGDADFNAFNSLTYGKGYQVYTKSSFTLELEGSLPSSVASTSLNTGWHFIPTTTLQPQDLSTALVGIDYGSVKAYDNQSGSLTDALTLNSAHAYWVEVMSPSTWVPVPANSKTQFIYDGDGGRVKQITGSGTTLFVGDILEKGPDGSKTLSIFSGNQRIASKHSSKGLRWYHGDHLGSTNVVTNVSGHAVQHLEYQPYGEPTALTTESPDGATLPYTFTGQRSDTSTGLMYYKARYYDPELGRFIQADELSASPNDPQQLNRYAYARNNPIYFTDPSGHFIFTAIAAIINAAVSFAVAHPVIAGAIVGGIAGGAQAANNGGNVLKGAAFGALAGGLSGFTLGSGSAHWALKLSAGLSLESQVIGAFPGKTAQSISKGLGYASAAVGAAYTASQVGMGIANWAYEPDGRLILPDGTTGSSIDIERYGQSIFETGANTSEVQAMEIARRTGTPVLWNPTHSIIADFTESLLQKVTFTGSAEQRLFGLVENAIGPIHLNAHSQATITTSNVLFGMRLTGKQLASGSSINFLAPAISQPRALLSSALAGISSTYKANTFDPINLIAPNLLPQKFVGGALGGLINGTRFHEVNSYGY